MKAKIWSVMALLLIGLIAVSGIAHADSVPVGVEKVYINDKELDEWYCTYDDVKDEWYCGEIRGDVLRGDKLKVEVKLRAWEDRDNVEVEASIRGLDHDQSKAIAYTDAFDVKQDRTYYKTLEIELPQRMDPKEYLLRIEVSDNDGWEQTYNLKLPVESPENAMEIKDVVFSPSGSVKAGRALYVVPRIKNIGQTEEDVKVTVSVPELGISASDYVDAVEEEDSVTSEELYLRIPECAKAGDYKMTVTVEYDDGDETVSKDYTLNVVENEVCNVETPEAGKTIVTVGSEVQDLTPGQSGVVYPITLSNTGSESKTYTVSAVAGDWANVKVSPSVVVVGQGETKFVYVSVAANEKATAGAQTFGLEIKSGDKTLKEITLKANVLEAKAAGWDNVKKGLGVALLVLVALLAIVGFIVGFTRMKSDDEAKEETYY